MAQFINYYDVDLWKPSNPMPLRQMACEGDVRGLRVGAVVTSNGETVSLGGSCVGKVVRADGATVTLTGVINGNIAYVVLDQASCSIEGPIQVAVCWVSGSDVTTLVVAYGTVVNTQTGVAIQPSTPIPDLAQLLAAISDMQTATAAANAAASGALGNFAPAFAEATANAAGSYVTYTDGKLYYLPSGHTANTTWANTTKTAVTVGAELSDLKSAIKEIDKLSLSLKELNIASAVAGWKLNDDGSFASQSGWNVKQCAVSEGDVLFVKSTYVWKFETGLSTGTVGTVHVGSFESFVTVPANAAYIAISMPIDENGNNGAYTFSNVVDAKLEKERIDPPFEIHEELGLLQENGQFLYGDTYHSMATNQIACSYGDVFYYYGFVSIYAVTAMFFSATGGIVSAIKSIGGASGLQHLTITAPQNAASVMFTSYNTLNNTPPLVVTMSKEYKSPLVWKKWFACGDSFTYGGYGDTSHVFTSGKYVGKNMVYSYFIGNRTNCDVQNIALDGMTIATHNGDGNNFTNTSNSFNYTTITNDADYVTLYFGINDNGKGVSVGDVDDTETTTFCGAYNFVLDNLTSRLTHGKIGIIVSNEIPQSFAEATISIAKKWGIPYLDLNFDESVPLMCGSLRPTASQAIKDKRNTQFRISDANHHPNTVAHEYESYFIEKWLLSL